MNKTYISGKVSDQGPRHNVVKGGIKVTDFTVKTSHPTNYLDVTLWDSPVAHHLAPGDLVFVEGSLRSESWETDGVKKYRTKVVADSVRILMSAEVIENPVIEK